MNRLSVEDIRGVGNFLLKSRLCEPSAQHRISEVRLERALPGRTGRGLKNTPTPEIIKLSIYVLILNVLFPKYFFIQFADAGFGNAIPKHIAVGYPVFRQFAFISAFFHKGL